MKKLLTFFFLLCCSGAALADSSSVLAPQAVAKYTDMSVYYLSQIFGTVGTVLTGSHSQMMGQLFYKLNWGIFAISGIVIGYAVLMGVVRMASEGVTMAPGKSTLFSLLKLSLGVALVIPNGATGYSLVQEVVMKVVVEGVGLADSIWDSGLNYLSDGGAIWSVPESQTPSTTSSNYHYDKLLSDSNTKALFGSSSALADKVFQSEVCMLGSRDVSGVGSSGATPYFSPYPVESKSRFNFPGINDSTSTGDGCGYVSWDLKGGSLCGNDFNCQVGRGAVSALVTSLMPAARDYYCAHGGKSHVSDGVCTGLSNPSKNYASDMFNAAMRFYSAVQVVQDKELKKNDHVSQDVIKAAKQEGWLLAGRYYWDIMQQTNNASDATADLSSYANAQVTASDGSGTVPSWFTSLVSGSASAFATNYADNFASYKKSVVTGSKAGAAESDPYSSDDGSDIVNSDDAWGFALVPGLTITLKKALNDINDIGGMFKQVTQYHYNPIKFLSELGQKCIKVTIDIWIWGAIAIGANLMVGAICSASNPYFAGASAIVDWVKPILMLVATAFWGAGFFLTYFIPIYPFMIFLFASIGWFISVVEAMVAAPLVALGLAHPENHDLLGKAEQAIMLLLGVFIQPALLVIGMIAGIIFSYVTFELLIYTYSSFIMDIMSTGTTESVHATTNILAAVQNSQLYSPAAFLIQPLLLMVFCTILYTLLTQSFSLVYVLRDNVMRWIGAPGSGLPSPEQLVGDTKGAVSSFGKQTGEAFGSSMTNYKSMSEAPAAAGGVVMGGAQLASGSPANVVAM